MAATKEKTKRKILIVNPHTQSLHVIAIMLHKLGYTTVNEVETSHDATEIMAPLIRENKGMSGLLGGPPAVKIALDLLILANEVDDGSGLSFLKTLRERFSPTALPIIYTVMKGNEAYIDASSKAGANDALAVPFPLDRFKTKIDTLFSGDKAPVIQSFAFNKPEKAYTPKRVSSAPRANPEPSFTASAPKAPPPPPKPSGGAAARGGKRMGGTSSFYRGDAGPKYSTDDAMTAELVDDKINGHYHEKVDVIGGGQNCFWAREQEGDKVRLEYISAKGRATGMEAKVVSREEFMYTFHLCSRENCEIIQRNS